MTSVRGFNTSEVMNFIAFSYLNCPTGLTGFAHKCHGIKKSIPGNAHPMWFLQKTSADWGILTKA